MLRIAVHDLKTGRAIGLENFEAGDGRGSEIFECRDCLSDCSGSEVLLASHDNLLISPASVYLETRGRILFACVDSLLLPYRSLPPPSPFAGVSFRFITFSLLSLRFQIYDKSVLEALLEEIKQGEEED